MFRDSFSLETVLSVHREAEVFFTIYQKQTVLFIFRSKCNVPETNKLISEVICHICLWMIIVISFTGTVPQMVYTGIINTEMTFLYSSAYLYSTAPIPAYSFRAMRSHSLRSHSLSESNYS